jgi:uncharacterized caspase-like protein
MYLRNIKRCGLVTGMLAVLSSSLMLAGWSDATYAATRKLTLLTAKEGEQKRVALVIGNSEYQSQEVPKLANPTNDARAMADALNKLGFNVTEVINGSQKEMNRAIAIFGDSLEPTTVALFYYAGHGVQVNGKNYLVPVDAEIIGSASISAETVDMDTVLDQLNSSKVSIVILDACRNNPFKRARSIGGGGLAQLEAPKGSYIAYATAPGHTAADGGGTNGIYTQELLKSINTPGISLEEVFKRVRVNVAKATSDEQIPWDSSSLTGNFYFNGAPSDNNERALWGKIKKSLSVADFETYLSQYPNGLYVKEAQQAKASLERDAQLVMARRAEEARSLDEQKHQLEEDRRKMEKEGTSRKAAPPPYVPPAF